MGTLYNLCVSMPSSQADLVEVAIAPRDMWVNLTCKILSALNTDAQVMSADVLISNYQLEPHVSLHCKNVL